MWITETQFKKNEDGYIFFPNGILGRGYKISEEQKAKLTGSLNRANPLFIAAFIAFLILGMLAIVAYWIGWPFYMPDAWFYGAVLVVALYYYFQTKRILRGAERTMDRLTFRELQVTRSLLVSNFTAHAILIGTIAVTAFGLFVAYDFYMRGNRLGFLGGLVLAIGSIVGLAVTADVIRLKRQAVRSAE